MKADPYFLEGKRRRRALWLERKEQAAVARKGLGEAAGAGSHRAMGCGKELGFPLQVVEGPGWF